VLFSFGIWLLEKVLTYQQMKRLSKSLNIEQWVKLFNYYNENVIKPKKELVSGRF